VAPARPTAPELHEGTRTATARGKGAERWLGLRRTSARPSAPTSPQGATLDSKGPRTASAGASAVTTAGAEALTCADKRGDDCVERARTPRVVSECVPAARRRMHRARLRSQGGWGAPSLYTGRTPTAAMLHRGNEVPLCSARGANASTQLERLKHIYKKRSWRLRSSEVGPTSTRMHLPSPQDPVRGSNRAPGAQRSGLFAQSVHLYRKRWNQPTSREPSHVTKDMPFAWQTPGQRGSHWNNV